jgi:hypothetical protein
MDEAGSRSRRRFRDNSRMHFLRDAVERVVKLQGQGAAGGFLEQLKHSHLFTKSSGTSSTPRKNIFILHRPAYFCFPVYSAVKSSLSPSPFCSRRWTSRWSPQRESPALAPTPDEPSEKLGPLDPTSLLRSRKTSNLFSVESRRLHRRRNGSEWPERASDCRSVSIGPLRSRRMVRTITRTRMLGKARVDTCTD